MESCIYQGQVSHKRRTPIEHGFRYSVFMMYLDLDELPELFAGRWLWSATRPALARFQRADHFGSADQPLAESIRDLVESETGARPGGPIRLLTNLSYFGYCFNPVSFYYCFSSDGEELEYIISEVNSTPWGERNLYVMTCAGHAASDTIWRFRESKAMHVSPFMPMDVAYDWAMTKPAERLTVSISSCQDGQRFFDASMAFKRKPICSRSLAAILLRYPFMTFKVIFSIYWQALLLWLKRCPIFPHPDKKNKASAL